MMATEGQIGFGAGHEAPGLIASASLLKIYGSGGEGSNLPLGVSRLDHPVRSKITTNVSRAPNQGPHRHARYHAQKTTQCFHLHLQ